MLHNHQKKHKPFWHEVYCDQFQSHAGLSGILFWNPEFGPKRSHHGAVVLICYSMSRISDAVDTNESIHLSLVDSLRLGLFRWEITNFYYYQVLKTAVFHLKVVAYHDGIH